MLAIQLRRRSSPHSPPAGAPSPSRGGASEDPTSEAVRADLQGNILTPYRNKAASYLFLSVVDSAPARGWLAELADQVTTELRAAASPPIAVNVAVTFAGLARLGVARQRLARLPRAFREGMAARAELLGDPVPRDWHEPFTSTGALHLLLIVSGDPEQVRTKVEELRQGFWQDGVQELPGAIEGERLPEPTEHFGYRDGISQPGVAGFADASIAGGGRRRDGRWEAVKAGEFVVGLPDEDGVTVQDVPSLTRLGSYLVLRKLEQDVPAFLTMVDDAARTTGLDGELVRAKLMGRWPDGTPLTRAPHAPPSVALRDRDPEYRNDFHFDDDAGGAVCPIGSHVRRANPRGSMGFGGNLEHRRRLIRRGIPYGRPYRPGTEDTERGLVFVSYQADIAGQFEFVQSQWLSDGTAFALGGDRDPVVAEPLGGSGLMRFEGRIDPDGAATAPTFLDVAKRCVVPRGGEYFLVPSVSALHRLARAGAVDEPDPDAKE